MTIEEAIKHCEEKANGCSECAKEHAELAEWLKELIELRENQDKYERALEIACKQIADSVSKTGYCPMWLIDVCEDDYVEYYKRKAGIEACK